MLPKASPAVQFVIGEVFIHGMDGVVFTLIYAIVLFPFFTRLLFGNSSAGANLLKGLSMAPYWPRSRSAS